MQQSKKDQNIVISLQILVQMIFSKGKLFKHKEAIRIIPFFKLLTMYLYILYIIVFIYNYIFIKYHKIQSENLKGITFKLIYSFLLLRSEFPYMISLIQIGINTLQEQFQQLYFYSFKTVILFISFLCQVFHTHYRQLHFL